MELGILKEPEMESRVSLLPQEVQRLRKQGWNVWVEHDAGLQSAIPDQQYAEAGAQIADRATVLQKSTVLLAIHPLADTDHLRSEHMLIGVYNPWSQQEWIVQLQQRNVTVFSLDLIPRISRAQTMDVLSSMSTLAGYKAVLLAASHFPKIFPMMMTAAGTIRPATVFVLGAGVAGLQAIATARRLGAQVQAFDVRPEVKEEVESLGASFIDIHELTAQSVGGYAAEQSEEFHRKEQEILADYLRKADVIITTALTVGRKAPVLLPKSLVEQLQPGTVIVDLAAAAGGNCELSVPDQVVTHQHVTIFAPTNLPATIPHTASQMYGRNVANFLKLLWQDGSLNLNFEDPIIRDTCVLHQGTIISPIVQGIVQQTAG